LEAAVPVAAAKAADGKPRLMIIKIEAKVEEYYKLGIAYYSLLIYLIFK
jgi:hypothetical protein